MGEAVGRADDERLEHVLRVEPVAVVAAGPAVVAARAAHVHRCAAGPVVAAVRHPQRVVAAVVRMAPGCRAAGTARWPSGGRTRSVPSSPGPAVRGGTAAAAPARRRREVGACVCGMGAANSASWPSRADGTPREYGAGGAECWADPVGCRGRTRRLCVRRPVLLGGGAAPVRVPAACGSGGEDAVDRAGPAGSVLRGTDRDRDLDRAAEPAGQRIGDRRPQPRLDHVAGEGVRARTAARCPRRWRAGG